MTTAALQPIKGATTALSSIKALGDLETFIKGSNQASLNAKFEEMIAEFSKTTGSPIAGPMTKAQRGFSLSAILSQSLQNGDKQMLEAALCISSSQHNSVLQVSLARLPIPMVMPLLEALVSRISLKPRRASHLLPWLKNLLLCHAAYLSTVPAVSKILAPLQQSVEDRMAVLASMQKLTGRLDLILTQSKMKEQMLATQAEIDEEPLAVYDESEDDEDFDTESDFEEQEEDEVDELEGSEFDEPEDMQDDENMEEEDDEEEEDDDEEFESEEDDEDYE